MRTSVHILCFAWLCGAIVSAQDSVLVVPAKQPAGEPWLGLSVSKPDDVTANQLPELPPGIGFVVIHIAEGGPAEKAGIRKYDLFWKMDGQMLVNEGQLATLLRLSAPGDEVTVSVFREGKSLDLKVILGERKGCGSETVRRMLADSVIRPDDGAMRIMDLEERRAVVTDSRGSAELTRMDEGDSVRILDTGGKVVFEGVLGDDPKLSAVPEGWRRQVCAMRRGLDHALSATPAPPMRLPRPRIMMPPSEEPSAEAVE
jgi:hypothetical protein